MSIDYPIQIKLDCIESDDYFLLDNFLTRNNVKMSRLYA